MNILECRNVTKRFTVRNMPYTILDSIDLTVKENETVLISGKSGEGKSVLLWLLAGLDDPDSGEIVACNRLLSAMSHSQKAEFRSREASIIFQDYNLVPVWNALENVEAALINHEKSASTRRKKASDMLALVGLSDRLYHLPSELSIGQRQRVAIARSLVTGPRLLFADEPTGSVDPATAEEITQLLLAPVRDKRMSLVVTSHWLFPRKNADRQYSLENRRLVEL